MERKPFVVFKTFFRQPGKMESLRELIQLRISLPTIRAFRERVAFAVPRRDFRGPWPFFARPTRRGTSAIKLDAVVREWNRRASRDTSEGVNCAFVLCEFYPPFCSTEGIQQ